MLHLGDESDNHDSSNPLPDPAPPPRGPLRLVTRFGGSPAPSGAEGSPIKEFHHVSSADSTPVPADQKVPSSRVSRKTRRWPVAAGLFAVVLVVLSSTACTPELISQDAIRAYWGADAACATRIATRESRLQPTVVNPRSGTTGLFQIHPIHATWIKAKYGYTMVDMKDPFKNARVAKALSNEAARMYGDGWQPWRNGGARIPGGGCPA